MTKRQMVLGLSAASTGYHPAAWRDHDLPRNTQVDIGYKIAMARLAEKGKFHVFFLADGLAMSKAPDVPKGARERKNLMQMDPLTLLPALAVMTKKIGLVATASTTYNEPYHLARKFATLDHISAGRAAWNIVTSWSDAEAQNFGIEVSADSAARYERAREFVQVVKGLWDSWDDDAIEANKETGRFFDATKLRSLDHVGKHFSVKGPLNLPRPPQGYPVIVSAGASEDGFELAAANSNIVYAVSQTLEEAQTFYREVKSRMAKHGRFEDDLKVMPGILPVVAATEEEAKRKLDETNALLDPIIGVNVLSNMMGDLSGYPVDGPVPRDLDLSSRGRGRHFLAIAERENLTIRQLYERVSAGNGHRVTVGTPTQIVDEMEDLFVNKAADGLNILPLLGIKSVKDFVEMVVPELQRRGLFHKDYEGDTLRDNLGVSRPNLVR